MYSDTGTPGLWSVVAATPTSLESASPRSVTTAYAQPVKSTVDGAVDGAKNQVEES